MGRTVRLSDDDERLLEELAPLYGGRLAAIREGLRMLSEDQRRRRELEALVREWEAESGPVDTDTMARIASQYNL